MPIPDDAVATLSTEDWIREARAMLVAEGIGALKIDRLARACNVTRGGFYWRFKNREDLLDRLLEHWQQTNCAAFLASLEPDLPPPQRYLRLARLWIDEREFDPKFDGAVRAWAAVSDKVKRLVCAADDQRVAALARLFRDAGNDELEAFIRARVAYFQQVGYYALDLGESRTERFGAMPIYFRILTGFSDDISDEIARMI